MSYRALFWSLFSLTVVVIVATAVANSSSSTMDHTRSHAAQINERHAFGSQPTEHHHQPQNGYLTGLGTVASFGVVTGVLWLISRSRRNNPSQL